MARVVRFAGISLWLLVIGASNTSLGARWSGSVYEWVAVRTGFQQESSAEPGPGLRLAAEKGFHVLIFAVFGGLLCALYRAGARVTVVAASGLAVCAASEALQALSPGRDPAVSDVLLNSGGTGLGFGLAAARRLGRVRKKGSGHGLETELSDRRSRR